jgi:hypothetical protein
MEAQMYSVGFVLKGSVKKVSDLHFKHPMSSIDQIFSTLLQSHLKESPIQ